MELVKERLTNISPSNLERRAACPASARLELGLKDEGSQAAARGVLLHKYMQHAVEASPEFEDLPDDERDACAWCMDRIADLTRSFDEEMVLTEYSLDLSHMGIPKHDERCRIDLVAVIPGDTALFVDYKFGLGYVRPPRLNLQFQAYAAGLMDEFGVRRVVGVKLQPFVEERWREVHGMWEIDDLIEITDRVRSIVEECHAAEPVACPGGHCGFCKARETCPARANLHLALPKHRTISEFLQNSLSEERRDFFEKLIVVESWVDDARKAVERYVIEENGHIPGWMVGEGRKTRTWRDEAEALGAMRQIALDNGKAPNDLIVTTIVSPAQAEKILGKSKAVKASLEPLVEYKPGRPCLAREKMEKAA